MVSSVYTSGSAMTASITPSFFRSAAVNFITAAASLARLLSFHKILANPSGDSTEYIAFSSIQTSSATASANAPPLPPSPITTDRIGTFMDDISNRFLAMASPCPRSSASIPQKCPRCIHKQKNRPFKFLGLLHQTKCFSISFRRRHSKMMRYIFFGRFSLCLCDHCNWNPRKPRDSTNDCSIISITAVSMKLQENTEKSIRI